MFDPHSKVFTFWYSTLWSAVWQILLFVYCLLVLIKQISGNFNVIYEHKNEHEKNAAPVDNKYSEEMIFLNYYPTEKLYKFAPSGINTKVAACTETITVRIDVFEP